MVSHQFEFDWTAAPPQAPPPDLVAFVARVRKCGLRFLRQLKALVDAAVREDELVITDDDIPF